MNSSFSIPECKIDVVIPCRDRAELLRESINSLTDQINSLQKLYVIDDYSKKPLERKDLSLKGIELELIRTQHNIGIGAARNLGAKYGKAAYIYFLDSDDLVFQGALPKLLNSALKTNADICSGTTTQFRDPNKNGAINLEDLKQISGPIFCGSSIVKRSAFEKIGGFSDGLRMGEWIDFISKSKSSGLKLTEHKFKVLKRRIHMNNYSRLSQGEGNEYLMTVRNHLNRNSQNL
jgi:glycosyltransferase involved in cell wall biosynthesis